LIIVHQLIMIIKSAKVGPYMFTQL